MRKENGTRGPSEEDKGTARLNSEEAQTGNLLFTASRTTNMNTPRTQGNWTMTPRTVTASRTARTNTQGNVTLTPRTLTPMTPETDGRTEMTDVTPQTEQRPAFSTSQPSEQETQTVWADWTDWTQSDDETRTALDLDLDYMESGEREHWTRDLEFILASIGSSLGIGNMWRFPWFLYLHGGAFLVAYLVLGLTLGPPAVALELFLGQFSSRGPAHIWRNLVPINEGNGWAYLYMQNLVMLYHSAVSAQAILFLFQSFVPDSWSKCSRHRNPRRPYLITSCFTAGLLEDCRRTTRGDGILFKGDCYDARNASELLAKLERCVEAKADWQTPPFWHASGLLGNKTGNIADSWACSFSLHFQLTSDFGPHKLFNATSDESDAISSFLRNRSSIARDGSCSVPILASRSQKDGDCGTEPSPWTWRSWRRESRWVSVNFPRRSLHETDHVSGPDKARCFSALLAAGYTNSSNRLEAVIRQYCLTKSTSFSKCFYQVLDGHEIFAQEEFLRHHAAAKQTLGRMEGVTDLEWRWETLCSLLLAWFIPALVVSRGVRAYAFLTYITVPFPMLMILVLLVVPLSQEGSMEGIRRLLRINTCELLHNKYLWLDAFAQVLVTNSIGVGVLPTLSSFSNFHNDVLRDAIFISVFTCIHSVLCGLGVAAVLGHMSRLLGQDGDGARRVVATPSGIIFIVLAQVGAEFPKGFLLAALLFFTLLLLASDTNIALFQSALTFLTDEFPSVRRYRLLLIAGQCLFGFLLALPFAGTTGLPLVEDADAAVYHFVCPAFLVLSCVSIAIYGPSRWMSDVEQMVGASPNMFHRHFGNWAFHKLHLKWYLYAFWFAIIPGVTLAFLILGGLGFFMSWLGREAEVGHSPIHTKKDSVDAIVYAITAYLPVPVLIVGGVAVYFCCRGGWKARTFASAFRAKDAWRPAHSTASSSGQSASDQLSELRDHGHLQKLIPHPNTARPPKRRQAKVRRAPGPAPGHPSSRNPVHLTSATQSSPRSDDESGPTDYNTSVRSQTSALTLPPTGVHQTTLQPAV